MSLFALDRVGDALLVLVLPLANRDLTRFNRLLGGRDLFIADRNAIAFILRDGCIRELARTRTALDVDFLMGNGHSYRLLLVHYIFAQARLARLKWLLLNIEF